MRILELFGGYGSQALALENLGIEFDSDLCDIDKYAIQAYNQLHGQTFNYGDICSIDETKLPYYDLITYSSPCQDFSVAGKQAGGEKGSGTRSSLLWECERIIRAVKPKYLLMENVKALTCKKFKPLFAQWLKTLESMGYKNWWKVLNAKDYGVPQNRERVFVVSILGGGQYQFPEPIPLTKRLKDILEPVVDEKYYLSNKITERFHPMNVGKDIVGSTLGADCTRRGQRDLVYGTDNNMGALAATDYKQPKQILEPVACASRGRNPDNPSDRTAGSPTEQRIEINTNGTTNTITTVQKDNYVIVPEATKQGYAKAYEGDSINFDEPNSKTRRGRVGHQMANTLTTSCNQGVVEPKVETYIIPQTVSVRKHDVDIEKLQTVLRLHKETLDLTNKQIAEKLKKPLTNVEHWFRTDDGFSIPEKDVWFSLKELLKIGTDEFDDPITTFEEKDNVFEKANRCYGVSGVSPTLTATSSDEKIIEPKVTEQYRIRKLTPRECWRLMGVRDYQFDKLHDISNSQLYKMAGNSIVVDVLMAIFKNLFLAKPEDVVEPRLL